MEVCVEHNLFVATPYAYLITFRHHLVDGFSTSDSLDDIGRYLVQMISVIFCS